MEIPTTGSKKTGTKSYFMSLLVNLTLSISQISALYSSYLNSGVVLRVKIRHYLGKYFLFLKVQMWAVTDFDSIVKLVTSFY